MNPIDIGLAFLEGLALIISPCILPVLPLILSTAVDGGRARPYGIITGFIVAFTLFALASRKIVEVIGIDLDLIKNASLVLLFLFGVVLLSSKLSEKFSGATAGLANMGSRFQGQNGGFGSGMVIGALIGLIWVPCAGPILAAVLVQVIRQETDLQGVFVILAFAFGAAIPMLAIALTGRNLMNRLSFLNTHAYAIRKVFGVLIIASVTLTYLGFDPRSLESTPANVQAVSQQSGIRNGLATPYPAPEFAEIETWLNSTPRTMESLKGKVVLIDFWTYSCINCVRTLPYVTDWHKKYADKGLVIIGVHAPEFEFEKKISNVEKAIQKFGIQYPVAVDNKLGTWVNFKNRYWPAHYLIDQSGKVVYTHFGEGEYATTEHNIRTLLGLEGMATPAAEQSAVNPNQTQELYLGSFRTEHFASPEGLKREEAATYTFPAFVPLHHWALKGNWLVESEKSIAQESGASLQLNFQARKVFLVMAPPAGQAVQVRVKLNGEAVKTITVDSDTLYDVVDQQAFKNGLLELTADSPGLEVYAFTFGG